MALPPSSGKPLCAIELETEFLERDAVHGRESRHGVLQGQQAVGRFTSATNGA
jgi:hypothetical protein